MAEPLSALLSGGTPSSPAIVIGEDGSVISYEALAEAVDQLAGQLAAAGIRRADRVAFALPNGPDVIAVLLAITALGAAAAPLNPAYTASEFGFYLGDIGPRLILLPEAGLQAAEQAAGAAAVRVLGVRPSGNGAGAPALLDGGDPVGRAAYESGGQDDVAVVLHTSGTTSRPKQVPLRQRNLMASARTIAAHYRLGPGDVSFCLMPLFHVHGLLASAFASLSAGGAVVVPRRFTPRRFWPQSRVLGTTWLSAGPTLHQMILDAADGDGPPASLRFARSCSSALSPALLDRAEREYGVPVLEAYGMTEASHQMASNPLPPGERIPGSVGVPTGTEIAIVGRGGEPLPAGEPGEVVIRGPGVFGGYAVAVADAFYDGWFRTGDQGVLAGGYLYLQGRLKEMILRGGENISPAEIEDVLLAHPAVRDAVCFGVPDEKYGELVAAAVTLRPDASLPPGGERALERALIGHCRERLAAFKVPASIYVLDAIPHTATGKVQRRRMAEYVAQGRPPARSDRSDRSARSAR